MFRYRNYDIVDMDFPSMGMNRDIDASSLPKNRCYFLDNFTQNALGEGRVRAGTKEISNIIGQTGRILRLMPFVANDGVKSLLSYSSVLQQDLTADDIRIDGNTITLRSQKNYLEKKDTLIQVSFLHDGTSYSLEDVVSTATFHEGEYTLKLHSVSSGVAETVTGTSIRHADGKIYNHSLLDGSYALLKEGLRVDCIPRFINFAGKLLITNGLDPIMEWDGVTLQEVWEWVKETAINISSPDARRITFATTINPQKYLVAHSIKIDNKAYSVESSTLNGNLVTLVLKEAIEGFNQAKPIFFKAYPPRCNYLAVIKDRLVGLGQGSAGIEYRNPLEALTVYMCDSPNAIDKWIVENTQAPRRLTVFNKINEHDNLEAVCEVRDKVFFIGRKYTQVYTGDINTADATKNTFSWQETIPAGAIHGDAIIPMANDVLFLNQAGLNTFSSLNAAKQIAATNLSSVNSIINESIATALSSNFLYRQIQCFHHIAGCFIGIKIGDNSLIHALIADGPYFFSLFSGDFRKSSAFLPFEQNLYMGSGLSVIKYADGKDGDVPLATDRGNAIVATWRSPLPTQKMRRFANFFYEIEMEHPALFINDSISLSIEGDLPKTYKTLTSYPLSERGDFLNKAPEKDFALDVPYAIKKRRFKFFGNRLWMTLVVRATTWPVIFKKICFFGTYER